MALERIMSKVLTWYSIDMHYCMFVDEFDPLMKGNELATKASPSFVPLKDQCGYDIAPTISFVIMYLPSWSM